MKIKLETAQENMDSSDYRKGHRGHQLGKKNGK